MDESINLDRTIGNCSAPYPALLELDESGDSNTMLKSVKEQLSSIPRQGIGFSVLRYMVQSKDSVTMLRAQPEPEVTYRFRNNLENVAFWLFQPLSHGVQSTLSPDNVRSHLLQVERFCEDGFLHMAWRYSKLMHSRSTIERLANNHKATVERLVVHCLENEVKGYTPSDFPAARLEQQELDNFLERIEQRDRR